MYRSRKERIDSIFKRDLLAAIRRQCYRPLGSLKRGSMNHCGKWERERKAREEGRKLVRGKEGADMKIYIKKSRKKYIWQKNAKNTSNPSATRLFSSSSLIICFIILAIWCTLLFIGLYSTEFESTLTHQWFQKPWSDLDMKELLWRYKSLEKVRWFYVSDILRLWAQSFTLS